MGGYVIRKVADLPPEEAALIRQDVAEAERGYSLEELAEGASRDRIHPPHGAPLETLQ